jgi:hypothetical protein
MTTWSRVKVRRLHLKGGPSPDLNLSIFSLALGIGWLVPAWNSRTGRIFREKHDLLIFIQAPMRQL